MTTEFAPYIEPGADPADLTWPVTPARQVKDTHTQLTEQHAHPAKTLINFYRQYMVEEQRKAKAVRGYADGSPLSFYPIDFFNDGPAATEFASYVCKGLRAARTYQITAEMTDAVDGMYLGTRDKITALQTEELISPAGFAWLDKPWAHRDIHGATIYIRAISWSSQPVHWQNGQVTDGTRVCYWMHTVDRDAYHGEESPSHVVLGELALSHTYVWPHGMRLLGASGELGEHRDAVHRNLVEAIETAAQGGNVRDIVPPGSDDPITWMHCLWMMLDAEITTSHQGHVDRSARRRAQHASLRHDDVQVITLRRARHAEPGEGYEPVQVDWSCRWLVQGHHRHNEMYDRDVYAHHRFVPAQFRGGDRLVCQTCSGRGHWVGPYVKGPDNKPMRHIEQVWRLSR